jgi:IMP cyclohydrolase
MVYLGRIVGVGLNEEGKPFGVYSISGRSPPSKERKAELIEDYRVRIGPSGELTAEQRDMEDLIFYNAIIANGNTGKATITNGRQTDKTNYHLNNDINMQYNPCSCIAAGFIANGGAEPDKYRTPRIGGTLNGPDGKVSLGIVTESGMIVRDIELVFGDFIKENVDYVSTYAGSPSDPREVVIPTLQIPGGNFSLYGKTAQKLADNMYDWMDKDFVVAAAAALWDDGEWKLAVRNLHE